MGMVRSLYVYAVLIIVIFSGVHGVVAAPQNILDYTKRLYKEGKYDSTARVIRKYLKKNGKSPQTEHLVPLIIEALIRQGEFTSAHRLGSMYRIRFPKSVYNPRIWYVEGVAFAKEEKFPQAINAFSAALNGGVSEKLDSLIIANTEKMCTYMAPDEFSRLSTQPLNDVIAEVLGFYEISKLIRLGQFVKAQTSAEAFRQRFTRSRYATELSRLMETAREEVKHVMQIGILAPISGEEEEIGKRVVLGAQLAISQMQPADGQSD